MRGFTLIEVVVALAIVSVVLVGGLAAASADARASERVADGLIAAAIAEDRLAEALAWPDRDEAVRRMPRPLERFTSRAEFRQADDAASELVTVIVAWPNGETTYSARRPLVQVTPAARFDADPEAGS